MFHVGWTAPSLIFLLGRNAVWDDLITFWATEGTFSKHTNDLYCCLCLAWLLFVSKIMVPKLNLSCGTGVLLYENPRKGTWGHLYYIPKYLVEINWEPIYLWAAELWFISKIASHTYNSEKFRTSISFCSIQTWGISSLWASFINTKMPLMAKVDFCSCLTINFSRYIIIRSNLYWAFVIWLSLQEYANYKHFLKKITWA